jgi:hypothetical protein
LTTYRSPGDSIRGDKILVCFGSMVLAGQARDGRQATSLSRNGFARVERPYRRLPAPSPGADVDEIVARTASGLSDKVASRGQTQKLGSHTARVAYLKGNAECTIETPTRDFRR